MHHPTARVSFDELVHHLHDRVSRRLVYTTRAPDDDKLVLYCYTRAAVFDQTWDPFVEIARGLVLHHGERRVLARPFPKFFNYGERSTALPDEPFEVFEKIDGSLGIVFHDGRRWRVVTKGSWVAEQSAWAERWLAGREIRALTEGVTYLFEIVYPENRIVVRHGFEGLVLLSAYDAAGFELPRRALEAVADALGTRTCARHEYPSVAAILDAVATFGADREGFVVRFASGHRVKIKGAEYLRLHRLLSRVTPLALWESWAAGDPLTAIRRDIPEEFWDDFDRIQRALEARLAAIVAEVERARDQYADRSNKEIGLMLGTLPPMVACFLFPARKDGEAWTEVPKTRAALMRHIRPTGNVLPGYTPSERMARMLEESG